MNMHNIREHARPIAMLVGLMWGVWLLGIIAHNTHNEAQLETTVSKASPMIAEVTDKHVDANLVTKDYMITVPDGTIEVTAEQWQDLAIGDDVSYKAVDDGLYVTTK